MCAHAGNAGCCGGRRHAATGDHPCKDERRYIERKEETPEGGRAHVPLDTDRRLLVNGQRTAMVR